MKFLMFSDLHHYPGYFMKGTLDDLHALQKRAEEENVDFMLHAGDLCHGPSTVPEFVKEYVDFHIPSYSCLGNHDTDGTALEETLKFYKMPAPYYYFDKGGYRMIIADPNYYYVDGVYTHFSLGNYYPYGQYRDHIPPEQLEWLGDTIDSSPFPCIIVSHQSFEREADGVQNREQVRDIINAANRKRTGSVLMCINGHYHRDYVVIQDNVVYFEMNSASYEWLNPAHELFPAEICEKYKLAKHTVMFNDPLSAIITLEGNTIDVKGCESSMFMGVTREMAGHKRCDEAGRMVRPMVQSFRITIG